MELALALREENWELKANHQRLQDRVAVLELSTQEYHLKFRRLPEDIPGWDQFIVEKTTNRM